MKKHLLTVTTFGVLGLACLSSCQTTGNPREGGLFQWSERKSIDRLDYRKDELNRIHSDTDAVEAKNAALRRELD